MINSTSQISHPQPFTNTIQHNAKSTIFEQIKSLFSFTRLRQKTIDNNSLTDAITKGSLENVKQLILSGADVNGLDKNGESPLLAAARKGDIEFVKFLLQNHANPNQTTKGSTPLIWTTVYQQAEIAQLLVNSGVHINQSDQDGNCPLKIAVQINNIALTRLFLNAGADTHTIDKQGLTPHMRALAKASPKIIELFIEKHPDVNAFHHNGNPSLIFACLNNHLECAQLLIDKGADINRANAITGDTPLMTAVQGGDLELVKLLISKGADVNQANTMGVAPLLVAAVEGKLDITKLLISKGADVNQITLKLTPLMVAIGTGHIEIVELLLPHSRIIQKEGELPTEVSLALSLKHANAKKIIQAIEKRNPEVIACAEELMWRRQIGHLANLKGITQLVPLASKNQFSIELKQFSLEGIQTNFTDFNFADLIKNDALALNLLTPDLISSTIQKLIEDAYQTVNDEYNVSNEKLANIWKSGKPILIATGFKLHYITVLVWNNQFVICDRMKNGSPSLQAFQFNPERFDEGMIEKLRRLRITSSELEFRNFCDTELPQQLEFKKTRFEEALTSINLPCQEVGNCAYANAEGILLPLLIMNRYRERPRSNLKNLIKEQIHTYRNFLSFQLIHLLNRYLDRIDEKKHWYAPDINLLTKAFARSPNNHKGIDPRIIGLWKTSKKRLLSHGEYKP